MDYNYHTHTARCRHAKDADEEYILRAIEGGIKYMGFSDHAPYIFPDGYESNYRVECTAISDYFSSLYALRKKYRDKIDLKIGFELEYYPNHFEKMLKASLDAGAEYLILGQHYIYDEHPKGLATRFLTENPEHLIEYVSCILAGMKSGVFTYVAHPDLLRFTKDEALYHKEMSKICYASKEYDIPLEINFLGIREGRFYPRDRFWELAGEIGSPITFGFDAHDKDAAYDTESLKVAHELVTRYNLNYIGKPKIIYLQ